MSVDRLSVSCKQFSSEQLIEEICAASDMPSSDVMAQVRYLGIYLKNDETNARSIVIEKPYVDRHYIEEYSSYYSKTLHPPKAKATRLHFFKSEITDELLLEKLIAAGSGDFDTICREMSEQYLGFTVVRPLPSAPIGRTILGTFEIEGSDRFYTLPPHPYNVHLCGLCLKIYGVPFQQQEQAVGACATTAIWSALSQVMRLDGGRAPTPFAVTKAATKNWVKDRVFPATSGLKDEQILESLRHFGYSPLYFEPKTESALFCLAAKCYLRSNIPVILIMQYDGQDDAHAVTVVGFREDIDRERTPDIACQFPGWINLQLRSKGLCRLYIHDDRLGPYARAKLSVDSGGYTKLCYSQRIFDLDGFETPATIVSAMIPLYSKIRFSAHDLIATAGGLLPVFRNIVGEEARDRLNVDLFFCKSGECLSLLYRSEIEPTRVAKISQKLILSRYVGVIKFLVDDGLVAFVLCDSTDIRRDIPSAAPLLAIIPFYDEYLLPLEELQRTSATFSKKALLL